MDLPVTPRVQPVEYPENVKGPLPDIGIVQHERVRRIEIVCAVFPAVAEAGCLWFGVSDAAHVTCTESGSRIGLDEIADEPLVAKLFVGGCVRDVKDRLVR